MLKKYRVCTSCLSIGITDNNCICTYSKNYPTIELEFEECDHCGSILDDGNPPDTEFNIEQFKSIK